MSFFIICPIADLSVIKIVLLASSISIWHASDSIIEDICIKKRQANKQANKKPNKKLHS